MSQVIQVRFVIPVTMEAIGNEFTQADSHEKAIDLALWNWSDGNALLKRIERTEDEQGVFVKGSWRYVYHVTLEDDESPSGERYMLAVLFARYKEKAEEKSE